MRRARELPLGNSRNPCKSACFTEESYPSYPKVHINGLFFSHGRLCATKGNLGNLGNSGRVRA